MRGANGPSSDFEFPGRRAPLHLAKKSSVVLENRSRLGVLGPKSFLHDGERPLKERAGNR